MPYKPAISSHSLGRAWVHDMPTKLDQAQRIGFDVELFYEDICYIANDLPGGVTSENLIEAAKTVRELCIERGIRIVCLQPFMHYEGLRDRQHHARRVDEMRLWIRLAKILNTGIIAIPSTCLSEDEVSGDSAAIVADLREVADLAASADIQIAYEALAWGTYVDRWEHAWNVVEQVDRPNFGICLDTFNIAARVYADPSSTSRRTPNAEQDMKESLERLIRTVDVEKIAYIQVVDAEYLEQPLVEGHQFYNDSQRARMSWSRNCRLFYGEQSLGAYLPIEAILKAILVDIGFQGWISAELFNSSLTNASPRVPEQHAQRAAESWRKIVEDFDLDSAPASDRPGARRQSETVARAQL